MVLCATRSAILYAMGCLGSFFWGIIILGYFGRMSLNAISLVSIGAEASDIKNIWAEAKDGENAGWVASYQVSSRIITSFSDFLDAGYSSLVSSHERSLSNIYRSST